MGRTLFVTGGHGFLGRRVRRLAAESGWDVVAPTSGELDVRDHLAVGLAIIGIRPDAIVHLAYRRTERDTIVEGSRAVARAASDSDVRLIHLSTDVVFGGQAEPYWEGDAPHPVEPYGEAKADAETAVFATHPRSVIVRTSLLLGDGEDDDDLGQPELDAVRAATGELPFTFFTDEVRSPTRALDVARAVMRLATDRRDVAEHLHVAGPEPLDRASLARRIVTTRGLDHERLATATTAELGLAGRRPGRVVLDVSRAEALGLGCRPV